MAGTIETRSIRARLFIAGAMAAVALCGCPHPLALVDPTYRDGVPDYVCGGADGGCSPTTVLVPGSDEKVGMTNVLLPQQCGQRFTRIVIVDPKSSNPTVEVWCAP